MRLSCEEECKTAHVMVLWVKRVRLRVRLSCEEDSETVLRGKKVRLSCEEESETVL